MRGSATRSSIRRMGAAPNRLHYPVMAITDRLAGVALDVKARCAHLTLEEIAAAAAGAAVLIETIGPVLVAIAQALQDL